MSLQVAPKKRVYIQRDRNGSLGFMFSSCRRAVNTAFGMIHYISVVDKGGAAEMAGLRVGHRILSINDATITSATHQEASPPPTRAPFACGRRFMRWGCLCRPSG